MAKLFKFVDITKNAVTCMEIEVKPENGTHFQLKEMQDMVEGYIEAVFLENGRIAVVDEEGRLKNKALNILAMQETGIPLFGNVLICERDEIK